MWRFSAFRSPDPSPARLAFRLSAEGGDPRRAGNDIKASGETAGSSTLDRFASRWDRSTAQYRAGNMRLWLWLRRLETVMMLVALRAGRRLYDDSSGDERQGNQGEPVFDEQDPSLASTKQRHLFFSLSSCRVFSITANNRVGIHRLVFNNLARGGGRLSHDIVLGHGRCRDRQYDGCADKYPNPGATHRLSPRKPVRF